MELNESNSLGRVEVIIKQDSGCLSIYDICVQGIMNKAGVIQAALKLWDGKPHYLFFAETLT